jgi:hypothetical protein
MKALVIHCVILLFAPHVYGQSTRVQDRASDFESKGVGLTETLLKFSYQEHLPIAIEYVDRDSMNLPVDIRVRNETIAQALDSILSHGHGYAWTLRNGMIEIKNRHTSQRAEAQLNTVIPFFKIGTEERVDMASAVLWRELQVALDSGLRQQGFAGSFMGNSSIVEPATLHQKTVRQILS